MYNEKQHQDYISKPKKKKQTKSEFVKEYAKINGCSESWVYKQIQWGKIKM